ncbi:MAG: hypothetical protein ABJF10_03420 [Chthoniobacter sp.]|uniref:hypothetical protein n=1 Tax=Chthoniobacter sp. TaxID=2510640 RepID=UPI0032A857DB
MKPRIASLADYALTLERLPATTAMSVLRTLCLTLAFCVALWLPGIARADAPATEFFAIETARLATLAPTDAALGTLSTAQLSTVSMAHGWYGGGLTMTFSTATFRIDARFSGSADFPGRGPASIGYRISASNDQTTWSVLSVQGTATKQGNQFVTENWRKQPVTVVLRFLDLKQ